MTTASLPPIRPPRPEPRHRRRRGAVGTLLLGLLAGALTVPAPAGAVAPTSAPVLTAPVTGAEVSDEPVLSWDALSGAASYDVQVSTDPGFSTTPLLSTGTVNLHATPLAELPPGSIHWRVRGKDAAGAAGPWSGSSFKRVGMDVPRLSTPLDGELLRYPEEPPVLSWSPTRRAASYRVEVDDSSDFVSPIVQKMTATTSYTLTVPQTVEQPLYWRVQAVSGAGINSEWSETRSYSTIWSDAPTLTSPAPGAKVTDVVLRWSAVLGAAAYELQVSPNGDWANNLSIGVTVKGTQYSPPISLDNASYFWRVRAVDGATPANKAPWSNEGLFQREWTHIPALLAPADGAWHTSDPTFRWSPVHHAGQYELQVGTDQYFNTTTFTCRTDNTSFTPHARYTPTRTLLYARCPASLSPGKYWWRVRGIDGPYDRPSTGDDGILGRWSSTRSFEYRQSLPTGNGRVLLADASTYAGPCPVDEVCNPEPGTPTMTWNPVVGASHYEVYVAIDPAFTNVQRLYSTKHTSLTPTDSYFDNQAGQSYYWFVRPCSPTCGPEPDLDQIRATFQKKTAPITGLRVVGSDQRMPVLSWDPYLSAMQYRVQVSTTQDFAARIDDVTVDQTTYAPWGKTYPVGPLFARVQAIDASRNLLTSSAVLEFGRSGPAPSLVLPLPGEEVQGVPFLQWAPEAYAAHYDVEVYKNGDTTGSSVNRVLSQRTALSAWSPTTGLRPGVYAWRVRRVDVDGKLGVWSDSRLFTLRPAAVQLTAPADGDTVARSLVFSWTSVQGAARYRWESSTSSTFSTATRVDTSSTAYAPTALPLGTRWWRVSSLDVSGLVLSTSEVRSVTTEVAGSRFVAVPPVRLLDTRVTRPVGPGGTVVVQVTGRGQVPEGAEAVVVNLTAVEPTVSSHVTAYPTGSAMPLASTLNNNAGTTRPNLAVVKLGTGGRISLYNAAGSTHLLADVAGYYSSTAQHGQRFTPLTPSRRLDTRASGSRLPLGPGASVTLDITDGTVVPSDATAVTVNVTAVSPSASSHVTVHPSGTPRPTASSLNNVAGVTAGNLVTVQTGTTASSRSITLYNHSGKTHLLVDVAGYYSAGSAAGFTSSPPTRVLDTRKAVGVSTTAQVKAGATVLLDVRRAGVPAGAKGVVLNLTATAVQGSGGVTAFPGYTTRPGTVNLSVTRGDTRPVLVAAKLGMNGTVSLSNGAGDLHLIADIAGWFE